VVLFLLLYTVDLENYVRNTLSKENVTVIVNYIGNNPKRFANLMELFFATEIQLTQRSAWVMSHCAHNNPQLITPYLNKLINNLFKPVSDAVKRNTLRILQMIHIPEPLWGETLELCFNYLESNSETIAIRAFAMTVAYNISQHVPEIKPELKTLIEDIIVYGSPGLKSRGTKILKQLEKQL